MHSGKTIIAPRVYIQSKHIRTAKMMMMETGCLIKALSRSVPAEAAIRVWLKNPLQQLSLLRFVEKGLGLIDQGGECLIPDIVKHAGVDP